MVDKERIDHIADLAKLYVNVEEYSKYQKQCSDILTEIEKITDVEIDNEEIMISPCVEINKFNDDVIETHIDKSLAFKNAKRVKGDYITVPKVIGEQE